MQISVPDTRLALPTRISIVVPVYRGERSLPELLGEIEPLSHESVTPAGHRYVVAEVLLVHDCGPDASDRTIAALAAQFDFVRPIWLTRNFGQHAATLAGMASAAGDWIVTVDEDGQQNPADIAKLLDEALGLGMQVIYARPSNEPPHGFVRNMSSRLAKKIAASMMGSQASTRFNSFRLVDGEIGRSLAAYCSNGVYLDTALLWIAGTVGSCAVELRMEADRPSGYSYRRLVAHFWTLVMTSGTGPLRLITVLGFGAVLVAFALAVYAIWVKISGHAEVQGWTSLVVVVAFFAGCILMSLGMIAEYLAVTMTIVMGKPLYVVSSKPADRRL